MKESDTQNTAALLGSVEMFNKHNGLSIDNLFICDDKTMISSYYLCDGVMDCKGNEDEKNCHIFTHLFLPTQFCKEIDFKEIWLKNAENICKVKEGDKSYINQSCRNPLEKMDELTFDFASGIKTSRSEISGDMLCIYKLDECGHLVGFTNGKHLIACESHICPLEYFKCPMYYCIPRHLACDGHWSCPGGTDEKDCKRQACPGLFKCRNSSICISNVSICNSLPECPFGDDENLCISERHQCPINCICLLYSISCTSSTLPENIVLRLVLSAKMKHVEITKLHNKVNIFQHVVFLTLNYNKLSDICHLRNRYMTSLDASHNIMTVLVHNCFKWMSSLKDLNISLNQIKSIESKAFAGLEKIKFINVSWNELRYLDKQSFGDLSHVKRLDITGNPLISFDFSVFDGSYILLTNDFRVCCLVKRKEVICSERPKWSNSCDRLLKGTFIRILIWTIATLGLTMNVLSCILTAFNYTTGKKAHKMLITYLSISDILYCISVLIILVTDASLGKEYIVNEHWWRKSPECIFAASLFITTNWFSLFCINLAAISRYAVIKNPFDSEFLNFSFIKKIVTIGFLFFLFLAIGSIVYHISTAGQMPSGLCLFVGHVKSSNAALLVTLITLLCPLISSFIVPVMYCLLLHEVKKSTTTVKKSGLGTQSDDVKKSVLNAFANLFCWIPVSVLLIIMMAREEYHYIILIWATLVWGGLNTVINPFSFTYSKLLS